MTTKHNRTEQLDSILFPMALYYDHELTNSKAEIYHRLLAEYDVDDIGAACVLWMQQSRFYPKANELIEIIKNTKQPTISIESRAQQQWRLVLQSVRQRGLYSGPPNFHDPITATLVKNQFTWSRLCGLVETDMHFEETRWIEAFTLAVESGPDAGIISAPSHVLELADTATKRLPDQPNTPADQDTAKAAGVFKSWKRLKESGPVDIEKRLELLKRQAEELKAEPPKDTDE